MDSSEMAPLTHEQIDLISEHTNRAANKALKRYVRGMLVVVVALLVVVGYLLHTKPDTGALTNGLRGSCEQTNVVQANLNVGSFNTFDSRISSAESEDQLAKAGISAAVHRKRSQDLRKRAGELTVIAPIDCKRASEDSKYRFPRAIPIGDTRTGKLSDFAAEIRRDSSKIIMYRTSPVG